MDRDRKGLYTTLNSERIGERDRIITLVSPSDGIIKVRIYGSQKSAKSIKAPLFSDGVFSLYEAKSNSFSLKDADITALRENILTDLDRTNAASLFSEIIMKARFFDERSYPLLTLCLDALDIGLSYKRTVIIFIIKFLFLYGILSDYTTCPVCQKVYSENEVLGYNRAVGASCCQDCSSGEDGLILPPNARAFIREAIRAGSSSVFSFGLSSTQEDRIFRFLLRLLKASFPLEINTLSAGLWPLS